MVQHMQEEHEDRVHAQASEITKRLSKKLVEMIKSHNIVDETLKAVFDTKPICRRNSLSKTVRVAQDHLSKTGPNAQLSLMRTFTRAATAEPPNLLAGL